MTKAELLKMVEGLKDNDIIGFYEEGHDRDGWKMMVPRNIVEIKKEEKEYTIYK
jgi:hypothetical protein